MANNIVVDISGGTATIATDEIASVHYQGLKLFDATDNSTFGLIVDSSGRAQVAVAAAIPAGGNTIGSVNVSSLPAIPAGANTIGSVNVLSLPAIPAGGNTIGTVNVGTMPATAVSTDAVGAAPLAEATLAGATPHKLNSAATTNATSVKGSAGKVYWIQVTNTNAAIRYLKFYNKASAPTVGSDTPVLTMGIPGNTAGTGFTLPMPMPVKFTTGIAYALTSGAADADTGAVAANEIIVNLGWV